MDNCITKYFPSAKSILEFGSGTGGHGLIFQKRGYQVHGLERSKEMVNVALKNGLSCEQADIVNFEMKRDFDIILALFHVISYITCNQSLVKVFRNAEKHLLPRGLFIFDVWYSPAVIYNKPEVRVKKVENDDG